MLKPNPLSLKHALDLRVPKCEPVECEENNTNTLPVSDFLNPLAAGYLVKALSAIPAELLVKPPNLPLPEAYLHHSSSTSPTTPLNNQDPISPSGSSSASPVVASPISASPDGHFWKPVTVDATELQHKMKRAPRAYRLASQQEKNSDYYRNKRARNNEAVRKSREKEKLKKLMEQKQYEDLYKHYTLLRDIVKNCKCGCAEQFLAACGDQ